MFKDARIKYRNMKIMSIFGTRPEIIRLSKIFQLIDKNYEHVMINTNQNFTYELNQVFFSDLGLRKPDYNLKVKTGEYGLAAGDIIQKSEKIILKEKPDIIIILGDTNSGLAAIPAAHHGIEIIHLEAGMRSYDSRMPEEKNRVIIDHLSTVLLPYTNYSRENLIRENIHPSKIYVVGNPIIEVINQYLSKINDSKILEKMKLNSDEYFLVTSHRSENVDDPETLEKIFKSLDLLHEKFKKRIIYPIHPRTISKIKKKIPKNIELINPLGFFDFLKLEKNAFCLITDSGTIPEEALYFQKPCVSIRETTERPEYIEAGSNILAGTNPTDIVNAVKIITSSNEVFDWKLELGDGKTANKVLNIISGKLNRLKHI
jgi:UDP-N-acetylglucosamine 2-epimerase (non-hydrolysing)